MLSDYLFDQTINLFSSVTRYPQLDPHGVSPWNHRNTVDLQLPSLHPKHQSLQRNLSQKKHYTNRIKRNRYSTSVELPNFQEKFKMNQKNNNLGSEGQNFLPKLERVNNIQGDKIRQYGQIFKYTKSPGFTSEASEEFREIRKRFYGGPQVQMKLKRSEEKKKKEYRKQLYRQIESLRRQQLVDFHSAQIFKQDHSIQNKKVGRDIRSP